MRTITLTERHCTECRLSGQDVDFLLSAHGTHLRIVPTRRRSLFRVTPTRFVGVIAAPGCRLLILPKVPLPALFHLLDPESDPDVDAQPFSGEPGVEFAGVSIDTRTIGAGDYLAVTGPSGMFSAPRTSWVSPTVQARMRKVTADHMVPNCITTERGASSMGRPATPMTAVQR